MLTVTNARIQSGEFADKHVTGLSLRRGKDLGDSQNNFVISKFDLSELEGKQVKKVILTFSHPKVIHDGKGVKVEIFELTNTDWERPDVTWNQIMPASLGKKLGEGAIASQKNPGFDVTDFVLDAYRAGKKFGGILVRPANELATPLIIATCNFLVEEENAGRSYVFSDNNAEAWENAEKMYNEWEKRHNEIIARGDFPAEKIPEKPEQFQNRTGAHTGQNLTTAYEDKETRLIGSLPSFAAKEVKLDEYGGLSDESKRQKATGFFYVKKVGDRFFYIDPLGYPFIGLGVSGITYMYHNCPTQEKSAVEKYGSREEWAEKAIYHACADLGFNCTTYDSNCAEMIRHTKKVMAYQKAAPLMNSYAKTIGIENSTSGSSHYSQYNTMPVFDPAWETYSLAYAKEATAAYKDDPRLLGWTSDNELPMMSDMLDCYLSIDPSFGPNRYSYAAAWNWLGHMTGKDDPSLSDITNELRDLFRGFVYDRYFYVASNAFHTADPNHMYAGCRFLRYARFSKWVLSAAGYFCDYVTFNWYNDWTPPTDTLYDIERYMGKPFITTEFYAKAEEFESLGASLEANGAGWFVKNQKDRGDYYQTFTLRMLECKSCIGWHWFQYIDYYYTRNDLCRASNKGIYSSLHNEYTDLTDMMKEINKNVYSLVDYFD